MKDLVILAADKDLEYALKGLLARPEAIGIREIEADVFIEPEHDPACALRGVEFLANFEGQYRHALLMFDHEGSGKEGCPRDTLQNDLAAAFQQSVWGERAKAIVLEPELEAWIWSDSPHVDDVTGWRDRAPNLRAWLVTKGWLDDGATKPARPKEAFEAALREARKPRSASLYRRLAMSVSVRRCTDSAFADFCDTLREWFPKSTNGPDEAPEPIADQDIPDPSQQCATTPLRCQP
jgi:hypothetical protein